MPTYRKKWVRVLYTLIVAMIALGMISASFLSF